MFVIVLCGNDGDLFCHGHNLKMLFYNGEKKMKTILKTKIAAALSAVMLGGLIGGGQLSAEPALAEDGLGDAIIFPYYTAAEGWQTFIRLINTSNNAIAVKVRFRERSNSRDVLDFMVLMSPHDMWEAWTDAKAAPGLDGTLVPGIKTKDTSCIVPARNGTPLSGESWVSVGAPGDHVQAAAFKTRALSSDTGNDSLDAALRVKEGHFEVIGVAQYDASAAQNDMKRWITHDDETGRPSSCSDAIDAFINLGTGVNTLAEGSQMDNVLAANVYIANTSTGQGAGYDPVVIQDFSKQSLALEAATAKYVGAGRLPSMNSADAGIIDAGIGPRAAGQAEEQYWNNLVRPVAGADVISTLLMRTAVINEWSDKVDSGPFNAVNTQWVVTFPTKNFYVDLANDSVGYDYSATLSDPSNLNDAIAPFGKEFDADHSEQQSCENVTIDLWSTEENHASFTSPAPNFETRLCEEVNVITFDKSGSGINNKINTAYSVDLVSGQGKGSYPVMPYLDRTGNQIADKGWAKMTFDAAGDNHALPVVGMMFTLYDHKSNASDLTTLHDHKYERSAVWQEAHANGTHTPKP